MTALKRFRALYGAGPLHLLALVASFAIAGAAVVGWFQRPRDVVTVLEWFAAAILIHDLVLLPLYSLVDRIAFGGRGERAPGPRGGTVLRPVNATPYLRIPAILSGLLLAVFFPVIFGLGAQTEFSASGIAESGYLTRWLLATGAMFALSGVAYAAALARARAPEQAAAPGHDQTTARDDSSPSTDIDPDDTVPGSGSHGSADPDPEHPTPGDGSPGPAGLDRDHPTPGDGLPGPGDADPSQAAPGDDVARPQGLD